VTAGRPLGPTDLKRLHRDWRRRVDLRLGLILDGVQNPYNLGSILRSAAAYRVEWVWLVPPTPGVDHVKVAKTALGSERLVRVEALEGSSGADAVRRAADAGFTTVAVELAEGAVPLFEIDLVEPRASSSGTRSGASTGTPWPPSTMSASCPSWARSAR